MPGLRWGDYPEQTEQPPGAWAGLAAAARALAGGVPGWRARGTAAFVCDVRAEQARLRALMPAQRGAALRALRIALRRGGLDDARLASAFAHVGVACSDQLGLQLFDAQLIAARHVVGNRLAEMATGEGKTLTVALAAASAALAGTPLHVITANDYLVTRDAALLAPVYAALGLSVGAVTQPLDAEARRAAYACDIAYCTAKELVFDYLRDGLQRQRDPLQSRIDRLGESASSAAPLLLLRGLCMAIVDEADSILIDEARVPLILSSGGTGGASTRHLAEALDLVRPWREGAEFRLDRLAQSVELTAAGCARLAADSASLGAAWRHRLHREDTATLALAALHVYQRDRHYLVADAAVQIVDETSGRVAPGRAWSRGLHQLIELKEDVPATEPAVTVAQITYQRFFARYLRFGGLSGTLAESRGELRRVYGIEVARVPLRLPSRRRRLPTRWFASGAALADAVATRVAELRSSGRPVLVGADSVAAAAQLSARLHAAGIAHARLDARHDADEACTVAAAGAPGAVTVATQMAGRGTDIGLGGDAAARGGLHILSCQLNASRRIDRQLAGRCARQGDPGSVETWLSLDSALLCAWLPAPLRAVLARQAGRLPSPLCRAAGGALQWLQMRRDAMLRARLLDHDRRLDRQLSFTRR